MGSDFKNELAWSNSRIEQLHNCLRLYWLNHYGYWNGWTKEASAQARLAYRLTKMQNLWTWPGSLAHSLMAEACRQLLAERGARLPLPRQLRDLAETRIAVEFQQSEEKRWEQDPKRNLNLFEHYYRTGRACGRSARGKARQKVFDVLDAFCSLDLLVDLFWGRKPEDAVLVETYEKFSPGKDRGGTPIIAGVMTDLCLIGDREVRIWDWKTGKPKVEDRVQVGNYGLWGYHKLGAGATVELNLVYLPAGEIVTIRPTAEDLKETEQRIRAEWEEMVDLCANQEAWRNEVSIKMCDRKPVGEACRWCPQFESCWGTRDIDGYLSGSETDRTRLTQLAVQGKEVLRGSW